MLRVRRHGRVNLAKVEIKFHPVCKLPFPCALLMVKSQQTHLLEGCILVVSDGKTVVFKRGGDYFDQTAKFRLGVEGDAEQFWKRRIFQRS